MTSPPPVPPNFSFGPFEVNAATGELRRDGVRVRLAGQPFRILLTLVARPGELVTREQLRDEVWGESTFVDFEHGLNAAVNKLRRALGDAAENPRYIETHPGRGYRFIGTLAVPEVAAVVVPAVEEVRAKRGVRLWWWVAGAAVVAGSFAVGWRVHEKSVGAPAVWNVTRLTADKGITNAGALSRDGKFVAFSSDRSQQGGMDLYVMQVSGGAPIRLTTDGANDGSPDFSPDGSKIVFDSNRDGGGIYEIGAFGGEMRLLVRHGLNPKYSPDGSEVAYWVGDANIAATVPGGGEVWVIPAAGGVPRRVGAKFTNARYPIWAPDGQHLLLNGYTAGKAGDNTAVDWWVVATHGDAAVRTDFFDALARGGLQSQGSPTSASATFAQMPIAGCWLAGNDSIIFSARTGGTESIWEAEISRRTNKATGAFRRLTAGAGDESQARCSSGDAITFTSGEDRMAIWSAKADLNAGHLESELELLTTGSTEREPALSGDGRFVAYSSAQSGLLNIWMRELATGKESHLAASLEGQRFPQPDATGSRVAYSVFEKSGKRSIYVWSRGEVPQKICSDCLRATGWTPDGKKVVIFGGSPLRIDLVDVETHEQTPLVSHKTYNIVLGRVSPDGRWVSFTARTKANKAMIAVAPIDGPRPVPESAWIKIADEEPEDRVGWSPDGKMLYFTSQRDGHRCFYAQRIDGVSRRPVGEAFAVQHFHRNLWYLHNGWSMADGKIVIGLVDGRENVWMMSRAGGLR